MELVIAAVLATLFVLVTIAFHLPQRILDGRLRPTRTIDRDRPRGET